MITSLSCSAFPDMPPLITADLHIHTSHSHGRAGVEAMYAAARSRGLTLIGFSEHSPRPAGYAYPSDYQEKLTGGFSRYTDEVRRTAHLGVSEGVEVLLGVELDYIPEQEAHARTLRDAFPFDYVIGGLHFQNGWGFDFSAEDWASRSREECFSMYAAYYADLTSMCQSRLFHIAAHPDLIKLFTVEYFHSWLATDEAPVLIKRSLTAMKDTGMAMEISSAGLRKPCKEIYPCRTIMDMAARLRLPVSFGSDAHCVDTPAFAFDLLARYAHEYGYTYSVVPEHGRYRQILFSPGPRASIDTRGKHHAKHMERNAP